MKVRPVAVVMSGAADDISCVVFHGECPGLGATLCGDELFVVVVFVFVAAAVVVARTECCVLFRSRHVVMITSGSPIGGEVSMGGGYLPHIINCSLVVLHYTVPVTSLDAKQTALTPATQAIV
jgi:hypothetical protein